MAQDTFNEIEIQQIVFPSDFKIRINSVVDQERQAIEEVEDYPYLIFIILDNYGGSYKAIYSPNESERLNVEIKEEEIEGTTKEVLYVDVENYSLKGSLKIKIGTAVDDTAFKDNKWNWYGAIKDLPAVVIK